jgi:hypothetical protein
LGDASKRVAVTWSPLQIATNPHEHWVSSIPKVTQIPDNQTVSPRHAALLVLAGMSLPRPHALPGTPITALASAFNCRF